MFFEKRRKLNKELIETVELSEVKPVEKTIVVKSWEYV